MKHFASHSVLFLLSKAPGAYEKGWRSFLDLTSYKGYEARLITALCWNHFVSLFSNLLINFQIQILSCFYEMHQHKVFLKNRLNDIVITFLLLQAWEYWPSFWSLTLFFMPFKFMWGCLFDTHTWKFHIVGCALNKLFSRSEYYCSIQIFRRVW